MAAPPDHPRDLQVDQDIALQHRVWRAQRVGWTVLGLFVLAGVLGLWGGVGPLNSASAHAADRELTVHYPRFARYVGPTEFAVEVSAARARAGALELSIARSYIDQWEMYGISPQPDSEKARGEWMVYEFTLGEAATRIDFHGRPHLVGWLRGSARIDAGEPVAFATWVHP